MFNKYEVFRKDNQCCVGCVFAMNIVSAESIFRGQFSEHEFNSLFKEGIELRISFNTTGHAVLNIG